ncbi:MAG: sensor histidine kinase, partial [Halobacteriota archaeon]
IIDQMVNLSSQGEEITETVLVRLEDVAKNAWEMVETANATLQIEDSKQFQADPSRLQQLFENLFRNAVEHGGPDVTINVRTTDNGIIVADDGIPIPEESRHEIFDPGFSTNGNLGYGLAIVKQIALGHGWEVEVSESDAGGTLFEIGNVTFEPTIYT